MEDKQLKEEEVSEETVETDDTVEPDEAEETEDLGETENTEETDKADSKVTFKEVASAFFLHFKNYRLKQILTAAYIPAALLYLEFFFRLLSVQEPLTGLNWLGIIFASLATGLLLDLICSITKRPVLNGWIAFIILQLLCAGFMLCHLVQLEFSMYIGPQSIFGGAGGIAEHASNYIIEIIVRNWPTLLIMEVPALLFLILFLVSRFRLFSYKRFQALGYVQILLLVVLFEACAAVPFCNMSPSWEFLTSEFDYDNAVRTFDVQTATKLDVLYGIFSNPWKQDFIITGDPSKTYDAETYNVMQIDFDELLKESTDVNISKIHRYAQSLEPSEKNAYTGKFKGMNLIEITAESFTPYLLDEELMPTLSHLVNNGIVFDDYYQPLWSGSTTTAEFMVLTGMLPVNGYYSMRKTEHDNMYLTIGNQFLREGYTSLAFHNGTYTYFSRHLTHRNLGYSHFYSNGSGMTGLSGNSAWPQSDVEMMEFAVPKIVDKEPFNAYFMTLSGHSKYDQKNFVVRKNIEEIRKWAESKNKDYTNAVLSYFAANLEFEKAMKYLLEELEKAGVLENTVIVMTSDHYPYALSDDYVIDDTGHVTYYDVEPNLINLFGFKPETEQDYSHNSLVIWTPSLDGENSIHVTEPVGPTDILPTLSNLFGMYYDSRLLPGRDVFAENTQPLVIFLNYSWLTERGYYDAQTRVYTPNEGCSYDGANDPQFASDSAYVEYIQTLVHNQMVFSQNVPLHDYYNSVFGDKTSNK